MSIVAAKNALLALTGRRRRSSSATITDHLPGPGTAASLPSQPVAPSLPGSAQPELEPLLSHQCNGKYTHGEADADDLESQTSTLGGGFVPSRGRRTSYGSSGSGLDGSRRGSAPDHGSTTDEKPPSFRVDARLISDATIGLSDGLTVPFALTAGLSALDDTRIVIYGGMAELIAGAISMGLGGYLGAKSEAASYKETLARTKKLINSDPHGTALAVRSVFEPYDLPKETLDDLSSHITSSPDLACFLMRFHHCEQEPASSRAFISGLTIALGYFVGGLLPLLPYLCVAPDDLYTGLLVSVCVMAVALFSFGYAKTCMVTGWRGSGCVSKGLAGGVQMVVVGGAAAGAAMLLVKLFNSFADRGQQGGGGAGV